MTKEERHAKLHADREEMIERFHMTERCHMSREAIHLSIQKSLVYNNFAFVLADVANTFLMDCERELDRFGVVFSKQDKYNFRQMLDHIKAAKKWAEKSAMPIYDIPDTDEACYDSDWWYNFLKLVDDRIGDDPRKTNLLLEYVLNMPSEMNLFDVRYDNFKRLKKDE